jgi:hypothetical protein
MADHLRRVRSPEPSTRCRYGFVGTPRDGIFL